MLINIGTGIFEGEPPSPDNKSTWNTFYLTHGLVSSLSANQSLTHETTENSTRKQETSLHLIVDSILTFL